MQRCAQLPSSNAAKSFLRSEPLGFVKLVGATAGRAALIAPGAAIMGVRGWQLVGVSVASATMLTGFLLLWYGRQPACLDQEVEG